MDVALEEQGIGHKSLLRFNTPELKGFQNAGV
jgi:phenol hydroxylase P4 protein